ncbi:MAG: glutathione S-transferase [Parvularcula sp.]
MIEPEPDKPLLYSFRRCPYAMRARMALLLSGQTIRVREILLKDKPPEMLARSPKGTVPVLITPDGAVMDESRDVMEWAFSVGDPYAIWPSTDEATVLTRQLIDTNDGPFKFHLDRYKYSARYEAGEKEQHRDAGIAILRELDARLARTRHLLGAAPSVADIAIFPFVRQFRIADPAWFDGAPLEALHRWLAAWLECRLFSLAMEKFPVWKDSGAECLLRGEGDLLALVD